MKKKQKSLGTTVLNKNKQRRISKSKLEWIILVLLVLLIPIGVWLNLFAYEYHYLRCEGGPLEVSGKYYKSPGDKGYGIHPGSDYSHCSYETPSGKQRDPSSKAAIALVKIRANAAEKVRRLAAEYTIYVPNGYTISGMNTVNLGDRMETTFYIATDTNLKFRVRELKKDSVFSYTNLCSKPAEINWSGTIIGQDAKGRDICRTNISKYITDYVVGINVGKTAIMLEAPNTSVELLNAEATAIFSSMEPYLPNS